MTIVKISTTLLFILLGYFLITIFSVKSNDIDSYLLGYEIFLNTEAIFDKGVWVNPYADFNLFYFYVKDHAFFNIIHFLKEKTGLSIRDAFYFYSLIILSLIIVIFSTLTFRKFILITSLYFINFFYLFNINQLRQSLIILVILFFLFIKKINWPIVTSIIFSFFHKSGLSISLFAIKKIKNIIFFIFSFFLFFLFLNYLSYSVKWVLDNDSSINIFGFNTFLYLLLLYYLFKNNYLLNLNDRLSYFLRNIILISFTFYIGFSFLSPIISIRFSELGIFFGSFLFLNGKIFSKNKWPIILVYLSLSIFNLSFLITKYL